MDRINALLMEDDARPAAFAADYLGTHGVSVTIASDGPRGLAEASRTRFDVELLERTNAVQAADDLLVAIDAPSEGARWVRSRPCGKT